MGYYLREEYPGKGNSQARAPRWDVPDLFQEQRGQHEGGTEMRSNGPDGAHTGLCKPTKGCPCSSPWTGVRIKS